MHRREFMSLACGAAAWPLAAHGQTASTVRRIGSLLREFEMDSY
jgi:hypothetical protein